MVDPDRLSDWRIVRDRMGGPSMRHVGPASATQGGSDCPCDSVAGVVGRGSRLRRCGTGGGLWPGHGSCDRGGGGEAAPGESGTDPGGSRTIADHCGPRPGGGAGHIAGGGVPVAYSDPRRFTDWITTPNRCALTRADASESAWITTRVSNPDSRSTPITSNGLAPTVAACWA